MQCRVLAAGPEMKVEDDDVVEDAVMMAGWIRS